MLDYAVRLASGKKAFEIGLKTEVQILGRDGATLLRGATKLNWYLGWFSAGLVFLDVAQTGQIKNHHYADMVIAVGSIYVLTGPIGWGVGLSYLVIDLGWKSTHEGRSFTESAFDQ